MIVKIKDLKAAISNVMPAVGNADNNMQQNCLVFSNGRVYAFNDEVAIFTELPQGMKSLEFAVPAKEFSKLLDKLTTDNADIFFENDNLLIKSGRSKSKFKIQSEIKLPIAEITKSEGGPQPLPKNFREALKLVAQACGKDMTKPLTTCVYFDKNVIVATDSKQCGRYQFGRKFEWSDNIYLPKASADIVSRCNPQEYLVRKDGWVNFYDKETMTTIACRTYYQGQPYVAVLPLFEMDGDTLTIPEKMIVALERAGLFSGTATDATRDTGVKLTLTNNKVTVQSDNDIGNYEESMKIEYDGEPRAFTINIQTLIHIVQDGLTCLLCPHFMRVCDNRFDFLTAYTHIERNEEPEAEEPEIEQPVEDDDVPF